jgi:hypothetical protein
MLGGVRGLQCGCDDGESCLREKQVLSHMERGM